MLVAYWFVGNYTLCDAFYLAQEQSQVALMQSEGTGRAKISDLSVLPQVFPSQWR